MPNSDDVGTRLDRLLRESAALRERSDALAKEAERLRVEIQQGANPSGATEETASEGQMSRGPASAAARVVLVVNDDPLVRAYTARVLAEAGYVVFTAGDKEEALALTRTLDDQLVLVVVGSVS
jgi:PleD family two-component response regulator